MKIFIALIISLLAVTGCVSSKTSSKSSVSKTDGKYVVWQDFTGEQQDWKQMPNAFVSQIDNFPVYELNQLPNRPYRVIGKIVAGTMLGVEPFEKVELEAVQFAKAHGADAIITVQNTPIKNGDQRPLFYHEWWAIGYIQR